jgi:hypothetical protein
VKFAASLVATVDLHMRTIDPEAGVDSHSGSAAAAGHADEARQDSIAEMECYKSHYQDPSTKVDYQDRLGHNAQSSYSKMEEKVMGLCCPVCDGSNEDKYRYLKQIQQTTSRKNSQLDSDGWLNKWVQQEVRMDLAWKPSLFADAAVEQELFPLSWRENGHISTHI